MAKKNTQGFWSLAVWALFAPLFVNGCGDDGRMQSNCGEIQCSDGQQCDRTASVPQCVCASGYTGENCDSCAPGYIENLGECAPGPVDCDNNPCVGGSCNRNGSGPDSCNCDEAYSGPTCAQCSAGFQDNDDDGTCLTACSDAVDLLCEDDQICRDDSGAASCGCPVGMGGESCADCEEGYYRLGDSACVPSCDVIASCGLHAYCIDTTDDGASCTCDVGYRGAGCSDCDDGYLKMAERCIASPDSGSLIAIADIDGDAALARIDATTGRIAPFLTLEEPSNFGGAFALSGALNGWHDVARDPISGDVWVVFSREIEENSYDQYLMSIAPDGAQTTYDDNFFRGDIAYVPDDEAIYAVRFSGTYLLDKFDIATGTQSSIPITGLNDGGGTSLVALAWERKQRKLLAIGSEHLGPEGIFEIDRATGSATHLLTVDASAYGIEQDLEGRVRGYVPDLAGMSHVLVSRPQPQEQILEEQCRAIAKRLGYEGHEQATFTGQVNAFYPELPPLRLESTITSGPEIIAASGYGGAPVEVQIATSNPDAFICLVTFEGEFTLHLMADAKFAGGVLHSYRNLVKASVDEGFVAPPTPSFVVHITAASLTEFDEGFRSNQDVFRLLERKQWKDRRLDELEAVGASLEVQHRLLSFNASGTVTSEVPLSHRLSSISPW